MTIYDENDRCALIWNENRICNGRIKIYKLRFGGKQKRAELFITKHGRDVKGGYDTHQTSSTIPVHTPNSDTPLIIIVQNFWIPSNSFFSIKLN